MRANTTLRRDSGSDANKHSFTYTYIATKMNARRNVRMVAY
jgi:hypothetical protein